MDSSLLQTLQEIKSVEDAHTRNYQPKTIDLASFVPKFRNVIIVDQQFQDSRITDDNPFVSSVPRQTTNCANGPIRKELITNKLGRALRSCLPVGAGSVGGWTIVLKEGLY